MRGVFNVPMSGAEELARYFLICLTFIAAVVRDPAGRADPDGGVPGAAAAAAALDAAARRSSSPASRSSACCASPACVTIANNLSNQTATLEMPFWLFMGPLVGRLAAAGGRDAGDVRAHVAAPPSRRQADRADLTGPRWKASSSSSRSSRCSCSAFRSCSRSGFPASSTSSPRACRSTWSRSARCTRSIRSRWSRCRCSCSSAA